MGNFMKAYTIAFEKRDGAQVASRSVVPFFKRIESILKETPENVIRRINGKIMRVHAYEWNPMNEDYLVIPIGKLKEKNKPFGSDPETQKLIDIPQEMFDVNSLAYHRRYNIALLSSNLAGPNENDVEDYFNSYLNQDAEYRIRLRPIMRNIALEKIRNAEQARSLTISLNVGRSLNDFISEQVHEEMGVREHLKGYFEESRCSGISGIASVIIGIYVTVWSIFATSVSKINFEILKQRIEGQLFFLIAVGIAESFFVTVTCVFIPYDVPHYAEIVMLFTTLTITSFVKFVVIVMTITKLNIKY